MADVEWIVSVVRGAKAVGSEWLSKEVCVTWWYCEL
jgi:hypothetical protein